MTLLPIIQRELLIRGRSRATYRLRMGVALAGLLICAHQLMIDSPLRSASALSRDVFTEIVGAAFLLCCGAALLAADVISAERRQGTLELLFLTRVKSWDVLLGKLVSLGVTSLCALIAFLPALMLPLVGGGIGLGETYRKALALVVTLLFALSAGLCGSAARRDRFKAARDAIFILLLVILVPYLCFRGAFAGPFVWAAVATVLRWVGWFSPVVLMVVASDPLYAMAHGWYWASLLEVMLLAWLLLVVAGLRLRRPAGEEAVIAAAARLRKFKEAERSVGLSRWEPAKGEVPPIQWLMYRQGGVGAGIWVLGVSGLVCSRWMSLIIEPFHAGGRSVLWILAWPLGIGSAFFGAGMIASVTTRFFASVRHTGELELLLTTPLGAARIIPEQWNVFKRFFVLPTLFLQLATLLPLLAMIVAATGDFGAIGGLVAMFAVNLANTLLGTLALCWLGLWLGLKSRSRGGAIIWSVALAQGVPWLFSLALGLMPLLPDLATLGFYAWLIPWTRRQLLRELAGVESGPSRWASGLGAGAEFQGAA